MYILKRTDGKYVANIHSKTAYTRNIREVCIFQREIDAARECCPDEEVILLRNELNIAALIKSKRQGSTRVLPATMSNAARCSTYKS